MAIVVIDESAIQGGDTAPNPPSGLTTEPEWDSVRLHWDNPSNKDIAYIEVWRNTTNNRATATMVAEVKANDYVDHSLETGTRYYWIRAMSTTGLESTWFPVSDTGGVSGTPEQVAVTSPVNNHVLQYDSASSSWINTQIRDATRVKGAIEATRNESFVLPPAILTSVTANNGIDIFSNSDASTNGYGAQCSLTNYLSDTAAGSASSASFQLRGAQGTNSSPSASESGDVMGTVNFSGHATNGFTNYVASSNQGGGLVAFHPLQIQGVNAEAPTESAFTLANAIQGGNYITRLVLTIGSVSSSGSGVFTNTSGDVRRNDVVVVTGTLTGSMTFPGYTSGNQYYVTFGANPTTTFTLSLTPGGAPVATTSGTTTGLTFTRYRVQFNYATQTAAPFAQNSKVTIAGSTSAKFDGTGYAVFSNTTGTAIGMYIAAPGNQAAAAGTIGLTNVTGAGTLRVRSFVVGQPLSNANRVTLIEHNSSTATHRSDTITLQQGSTTTTHLVLDTAKATFTKPVVFPSYTIAGAGALTGAAGWQISISDSTGNGGRMAYWDTTNSRWNYVSDDTAV